MSRPEISGQPRDIRPPDEQIKYFFEQLRVQVYRGILPRLQARVDELGLKFSEEEFIILAALDTPERLQEFLNTQLYYNYDHSHPGQQETAHSPRGVLRAGAAHCFEGALLAYTVNYLHGHNPQMVLLEGSEDSDHNLVLYRDSHTGLYGCNAHSGYANLDGRPARYDTIRALVESYRPYYYSDYTLDPNDLTLVGYSEPFDLVSRYGTAWMDSPSELWDIYSTYIDDSLRFHYLNDSNETHIYPWLTALKENWIRADESGKTRVSTADLPQDARWLWDEFWHRFDEKMVRPRGAVMDIAQQFFRVTGMSPLDLREYAHETEKFLARGYRTEELFRITNPPIPHLAKKGRERRSD